MQHPFKDNTIERRVMKAVRERIADAQIAYEYQAKEIDSEAWAAKEETLAECHEKVRRINEERDKKKESVITHVIKSILG